MYHTLSHLWKELLQAGMQEDGLPWDWTTLGVRLSADQKLKAHLVAKSDGVWAAESLVKSLPSMGSSIQAQSLIQNSISTPTDEVPSQAAPPMISKEELELIVKQQVQAMLEKMTQKLLPELAERVIKQEIHRLLSEPESKSGPGRQSNSIDRQN